MIILNFLYVAPDRRSRVQKRSSWLSQGKQRERRKGSKRQTGRRDQTLEMRLRKQLPQWQRTSDWGQGEKAVSTMLRDM